MSELTYEGHYIGQGKHPHCQKVGYGSRGERYLTERRCTCQRNVRLAKRGKKVRDAR